MPPGPIVVGHDHICTPISTRARTHTCRPKPIACSNGAGGRCAAKDPQDVDEHGLKGVMPRRPQAPPVACTADTRMEAKLVVESTAGGGSTNEACTPHRQQLRQRSMERCTTQPHSWPVIPCSLWVQIVQKGSDLSPTTSWDLFYLRSEPRMLRSEPTTLGSEMKKIPTCS